MENLVSVTRILEYYKGKKVFITGHTGFKGSWLMASLQLAGARIKGYALPTEYEGGSATGAASKAHPFRIFFLQLFEVARI